MRTRIMLTGAVLILCGVPILSASESGPCRSVGARSIVCLPPRGTSARRAVSSRAVGAATSAAACELDKISTGVTVKSRAQNLASNNTVGSGGQGKASDLEACPGSASTGEKRTRSTRRCQHLEGCEAAPGLVIYGDANDGVQRYCGAHRVPGEHVNLAARRRTARGIWRCKAPGCIKMGIFGDPALAAEAADDRQKLQRGARKSVDLTQPGNFSSDGNFPSGNFSSGCRREVGERAPVGTARPDQAPAHRLRRGDSTVGQQPRSEGLAETFCRAHKLASHEDVFNRRCAEPLCKNRATFKRAPGSDEGDTPKSKPEIVCRAHRANNVHWRVQGRRCAHANCETLATFGMHGRGKRWCALHRNHEPGSVDVKNRKCSATLKGWNVILGSPGVYACPNRASFGLLNEGGARFCSLHKESWHYNLVSKRCEMPNCDSSSSYGDPFERTRRFCREHAPQEFKYLKSDKINNS